MLRLSRLTDYAVALLAQMAQEEKRIWAASELAEATHLPQPTVSKILKNLTKSELITAQRGVLGGYRLATTADKIPVSTIIEAMDGPIAITDCAEGGDHSCHVESTCPMQARWNIVNHTIKKALQNLTLADMANYNAAMPRHIATPATKTGAA